MILAESVLVESKSARDNHLERVSHDSAQNTLNKVKALYFALWKGMGTATTEQLAEFYEVPEVNIRQLVKPYRDEFEADGLKVLRGNELKDASKSILLATKTTQLTIWTPRSALRLGMILRDSAVAKAVRTSLLDAAQAIPTAVEKVRELELQLAITQAQRETAQAQREAAQAHADTARTQERLMLTSQAIASIHGSGMVALIMGKPDALVERVTEVEKIVLCNEQGQPLRTFRGLSKTKLAKRFGMKKPQEFVNWLESVGKTELLQSGMTATPCQYVPFEFLPELDRLWAQRQGSRQRLLGE